MKVSYINAKANNDVILFFNGWGMDDRAISHISSNDFDVIMLNQFHDFQFDDSFLLKYKNVYIVAWSLGVWVAQSWMYEKTFKPTKSVAINGTCKPIDALLGISPDSFNGTIDFWNESNRTKFQIRMFGERNQFSNNLNKLPIRTLTDQKQELEILRDSILSKSVEKINWNKSFIGSNDLIFTPQNQYRFWEHKTNINQLQMPHYPFIILDSWEKILE